MDKKFFCRNVERVARELLGKVLVVNGKKVKIVETEAYYGEEDPASRACKNGDLKETMKMEAGTLLVYGIHNNWLLNFVTGREGKAEAVLLRAGEPINFSANCSGPGLLTRALGIEKSFHKSNIFDDARIGIENGEKVEIVRSKRIGVARDLKKPLRFYVKNNKFVSKR